MANKSTYKSVTKAISGAVFPVAPTIFPESSIRNSNESIFRPTIRRVAGDYNRWRRTHGEDIENIAIMLIPKLQRIFPEQYDYFRTEQFLEKLSYFLYKNSY